MVYVLCRCFIYNLLCSCLYCSCVEQLKEFATRLEATGVTLEDISDEASGTSEASGQTIYHSSAQLLSMFLEKLVV